MFDGLGSVQLKQTLVSKPSVSIIHIDKEDWSVIKSTDLMVVLVVGGGQSHFHVQPNSELS